MRRFFITLALFSMLVTLWPMGAVQGSTIGLFVDGQPLLSDTPPVLLNNRTMVPLRVVGEALGASVLWTSNQEPIIVRKGDDQVVLRLNERVATVNGQPIELDVPAQLVNQRTMVPLRFVGESLGADVLWVPSPPSVHIAAAPGQLSSAQLSQGPRGDHVLSFTSDKDIRVGSPVYSNDGSRVTFPLSNVSARQEEQAIENGLVGRFEVFPRSKDQADIVLDLGGNAAYLAPQATLKGGNRELQIAWPVALNYVSWEQQNGQELISFRLPEGMNPQVTPVTFVTSTESTLPGMVTSDAVRVRVGPSLNHDIVRQVNRGTRVQVLSETTGWYNVRLTDGTEGWIADWLVAVETSIEEPAGVNVRSGPGTNHSRLTVLYPGHKINVLKRENGWCYVNYGGNSEGWIADWLVPIASRLSGGQAERPGLQLLFRGVDHGVTSWQPPASSNIATASWSETEDGKVLTLELKQQTGYRIERGADGYTLRLGNQLQGLELISSERGISIRLQLDASSQPKVSFAGEQQALIISVPGASIDSAVPRHITGDGQMVAGIQVEQSGSDVQVRINLVRHLAYSVMRSTDQRELTINLSSPTLAGKVIAIDPGHGGSDPGAVGTRGWNEREITHDIAYRLRDLLTQAGATVVMTREYESPNINGAGRAVIINAAEVDAFISIHNNAATNRNARGIETYYYPRNDNERLAQLVQAELLAELGWPNRGVIPNTRFVILRDSQPPGVLAEIGFISNWDEETLLLQPEIRQRAAEALMRALERYFAG